MLSLARPTLSVGIVPADVDAMRSFYADVLGLPVQPPTPVPGGSLVRHQLGTSDVKLFCSDAPVERSKGGMHHTIGYRLLTMVFADLAPILERAEAAGRSIDRSTYKGMDLAFLTDPDGNLLELVGVPTASEPLLQVGMSVGDHEATRAFYVDALGLAPEDDLEFDGRTRHSVRFGTTTLKWFAADAGAPVHTGPITDRAGIRYLTAWVEGLDAAVADLTARGVPFPVPVTDIGIARIAIMADPDGSWIELAEAAS